MGGGTASGPSEDMEIVNHPGKDWSRGGIGIEPMDRCESIAINGLNMDWPILGLSIRTRCPEHAVHVHFHSAAGALRV
jgi:hypothetical protein